MSWLLNLPGIRYYMIYRTENDLFDRFMLRGFWGFCAGSLYSIGEIPEIKRGTEELGNYSNMEKTFLMTGGIFLNGFCHGAAGAYLFSIPLISIPVYCVIKFEDVIRKRQVKKII